MSESAVLHNRLAAPSAIRFTLIMLATAAAYFVAARLFAVLSHVEGQNSLSMAIWPSGGIALAAMWRFGRPALIGTLIGATSYVGIFTGNPWLGLFGGAVIVLPVQLSIYLLRKRRVEDLFNSPRSVALFTVYGGTIAAGLSAGAWFALSLLGYITTSIPPLHLFLNWYGATMLGICLLTPPLIAYRDWCSLTSRQWLEVSSIFGAVLLSSWYLFGVAKLQWNTPLATLAMPFILGMALRFHFGIVATMTLLQAMIALAIASHGLMGADVRKTYSFLQIFLSALALSNLAIGAGRAAIAQAFARLRHSEARFRSMFEQATIGLMLRDTRTGERLVNQKLCEMLGYAADELPGPTLTSISLPDEMAITHELSDQLLRGEIKQAQQEKRYRRKDGELIWASVTMSMLSSDVEDGQLFVGMFEDITTRKRIEAQIRGQSSILGSLTLGAPLQDLLDQIALLAEELIPRSRCAIFTADRHKDLLYFAAGPHLPGWQPGNMDAIPIAEGYGCAATAAARKEIVIARNTATDPLCVKIQEYLKGKDWGQAIWAIPCINKEGQLLSVATLYIDQIGEPSAQDRELLQTIAWLTAAVIQRYRDALDLRDSEQRLRLMFEQAAVGVTLSSRDGSEIQINQKYVDIVGYSREELLDSNFKIFIPPDERERVDRDVQRLSTGEIDHYRAQRRYIRKDGREIWCNVTTSVVYDERGEISLFIGLIEDITERKLAEAEIERLALFDALTGLPNRRLFSDRLQTALSTSRRSGQFGALFYIDLDNFKQLNDARGHAAGDDLLQQIALRLRKQLREEDTVARLGGDEFVVLLQNIAGDIDNAAAAAATIAQKLRTTLTAPYLLRDGIEHLSTASVGITLFPKDDESADDLMKQADIAMYRVKAEQRNAFRFYAPEMRAAANHRIALERDFRQALQQNAFEVFLQPQFDAEQKIVGSEALLRWRRADNQFVSPAEFIPVAEQTGLIVTLGEWVIAEVAKIIRDCELNGYDLSISVNVSPRQFQEINFVERVRDILWEHGADAGRLIVEITEGSVMADFEDARAKMNALKKLGIRLSIDDFGTGHSSLAYLKRLPLHELKIDREFVNDLPHAANDVALVEAILAVTRHLQLEVVAEGVETGEQLAFLAQRNCHRFQGFYLARPQPVADYMALLIQHYPPATDNPDDLQQFID